MIPVTQENLGKLIQEMRNCNVSPLYLPFEKEVYPIQVALIPLLAEISDFLRQTTPDDLEFYYLDLPEHFQRNINKSKLLSHDEDTLVQSSFYFLQDMVWQKFEDHTQYLEGNDFKNSLIRAKFGELDPYFDDKHHLLALNAPGLRHTRDALRYKGYSIQYHQFLRNYFNSNFNYNFLYKLLDYSHKKPNHKVTVAVDHLKLVEDKWFNIYGERAGWEGTPFSWKDLDDPNKTGMAKQGLPLTFSDPFTNPFSNTEFYWTINNKEPLKTLQVEEIYTLPPVESGKGLVISRYLHSIRDIDKGYFYHLDGAVRIYDIKSYDKRFDIDMAHPEYDKNISKYIKLFRIDSRYEYRGPKGQKLIFDEPIDPNVWSELVCLYFYDNFFVPEYFGLSDLNITEKPTAA